MSAGSTIGHRAESRAGLMPARLGTLIKTKPSLIETWSVSAFCQVVCSIPLDRDKASKQRDETLAFRTNGPHRQSPALPTSYNYSCVLLGGQTDPVLSTSIGADPSPCTSLWDKPFPLYCLWYTLPFEPLLGHTIPFIPPFRVDPSLCSPLG